ncbi:hypothetical protein CAUPRSCDRAFT_11419 [Caulochytrium protostelioides]|uniref:Uncharacterized protein n=1 Tax=Caulochytrium protostelioides TaxID=1555241 RepID=A0A4P9WX37_9FUNG|nr:hypothetical protein CAUPRSCDRAFT_11419 [Caulochytrium protostelioides]
MAHGSWLSAMVRSTHEWRNRVILRGTDRHTPPTPTDAREAATDEGAGFVAETQRTRWALPRGAMCLLAGTRMTGILKREERKRAADVAVAVAGGQPLATRVGSVSVASIPACFVLSGRRLWPNVSALASTRLAAPAGLVRRGTSHRRGGRSAYQFIGICLCMGMCMTGPSKFGFGLLAEEHMPTGRKRKRMLFPRISQMRQVMGIAIPSGFPDSC